ncbi:MULTISPECIES: hypothetical protein [unclassified Methylobacterium]|uniref:hypothetical protein n=1 Tax=unclassified Methylobacterium TaxID=2615210 RepID=UPI000CBA262A|nr:MULTISPECIES: hypothetical protein [unclassified Methylobacterium]PIU05171.1 MAG: hypothetical protein COT56_16205 [Methylobacterium sp. CG09_land_8_20_14_0_10_71_15]PIU12512.1 MAG: hypothetical protein COT28_14595 [Methylobacterium sp. CG08_land_8_20_14_0_20_71_15]GBU16234.1 hypothetical protein AwMethylo_04490 [Methylobacterium sp.]
MTKLLTVHDLHLLDEAPRIQDLKLAAALGFEVTREIRRLIERNVRELAQHGEVCVTIPQTGPRGGRPGKEYWLNEGQAVLICMFSRTEKAAEVRQTVISVFMAWRRGQAPVAAPSATGSPVTAAEAERPLAERREARRLCEAAYVIHGPLAARRLWDTLNLPAAHGADRAGERMTELAHEALRHILDAAIEGEPLRDWLDRAIHLDVVACDVLRAHGVLVSDAEAGIVIGRSVPFVAEALAKHRIGAGCLRDLSGAREYKVTKFAGRPSRGTFVPYATLDTEMVADA